MSGARLSSLRALLVFSQMRRKDCRRFVTWIRRGEDIRRGGNVFHDHRETLEDPDFRNTNEVDVARCCRRKRSVAQAGSVRAVHVSRANVHDNRGVEGLVPWHLGAVDGDAAYESGGIHERIRARRRRPLTPSGAVGH